MRKNRLKDEECLMRISQVLAENMYIYIMYMIKIYIFSKNLETEGYGNIKDFE